MHFPWTYSVSTRPGYDKVQYEFNPASINVIACTLIPDHSLEQACFYKDLVTYLTNQLLALTHIPTPSHAVSPDDYMFL